MRKIIVFYLLFLTCFSMFSQEKLVKSNDEGLTRFTFGIQRASYNQASFSRANYETTGNSGNFDISNSRGFFINYKILRFRNHGLKIGLFSNSLRHDLTIEGSITDIRTGTKNKISHRLSPNNEQSLEYCVDYSYLFKLSNKWFLDVSFGISQERNQTLGRYSSTYYFADSSFNPYQTTAKTIYFYKQNFFRYNYAASIGYRIESGLINLGVKLSFPEAEIVNGQYEFFEPGLDEFEQGFGAFKFSGRYISATLSFTPSKDIFKKKK